MSIMNWPEEDRPREKLLHKGEQALTDAELIAIILKSGIRGKTALDIAKGLLMEYGDLKKLLHASHQSLIHHPGIGHTKYVTLKAAMEIGKRCLHLHVPVGTVLNNSRITQQFLAERLQDYKNEVFSCLFMDNHFRLIRFEILFHGTIHSAAIYPREIVKRGLEHNAAHIILAHNHPSGVPIPSTADKEITLHIKQALNLIDIEVIDHIIIGNPTHFSFAEAGLL